MLWKKKKKKSVDFFYWFNLVSITYENKKKPNNLFYPDKNIFSSVDKE